jgi:hypothetical protein
MPKNNRTREIIKRANYYYLSHPGHEVYDKYKYSYFIMGLENNHVAQPTAEKYLESWA